MIHALNKMSLEEKPTMQESQYYSPPPPSPGGMLDMDLFLKQPPPKSLFLLTPSRSPAFKKAACKILGKATSSSVENSQLPGSVLPGLVKNVGLAPAPTKLVSCDILRKPAKSDPGFPQLKVTVCYLLRWQLLFLSKGWSYCNSPQRK